MQKTTKAASTTTWHKPKVPKTRILSVRSRHPSADSLKGVIRVPFAAIYRHGSTTESELRHEINSIDCVRTSSSKLLMKKAFDKGGVKHLPWLPLSAGTVQGDCFVSGETKLKFPLIVKSRYGSRGEGNHKIDTPKDFNTFLSKGVTKANYIVEPYFSGPVEFRIHISKDGPIYSLRKMLKTNIPEEKRWVRNDDTCVWITEFAQNRTANGKFISFKVQDNSKFDRPGNWNEIVEECKKALKAVGGDLLAVDVKSQSSYDSKKHRREKVEFYILEVNSAPSMGEITTEIYKRELPAILRSKYDRY